MIPCTYCDTAGHERTECPERLEDKFGTAELRDSETRDDDNTHTRRTEKQLAMADDEVPFKVDDDE